METDYEGKRQKNILRNQEILKELGLIPQVPASQFPTRQILEQTERIAKPRKGVKAPERRSLRINGTLNNERYSNHSNHSNHSTEIENVQILLLPQASSLKPKSRRNVVQERNIQPGTTRAMSADLSWFLSNLALPIDRYGKAAVIEMAGSGMLYKFNKYSGITEWNNSLFLWVNFFDEKSEFINSFLDNGKLIRWFGGSKMHKDSPVIQRLVDNNDGKRKDDIILFARLPAEPYFCLGRCKAKEIQLDASPITIIWELLDYDTLSTANLFHELINQK